MRVCVDGWIVCLVCSNHFIKFKLNLLYFFQIFTAAEEQVLADHAVKRSKMFHDLSVKQTRKLAREYACANLKKYPECWDVHQEADVDWIYGLISRNLELSLRTPEATSISRATSFSVRKVNMFFDKYDGITSCQNFNKH